MQETTMDDGICAIDFGTCNSAVAMYSPQGNWFPAERADGKSERSVLFFPPEKQDPFVGDEAILQYKEWGMRGRFLQSIKSILPDKHFESTNIYGQDIKLELLVAYILVYLKHAAEKSTGQTFSKVVLGRPVRFSTNPDEDKIAEKRLLFAARVAGFKDVRFVAESVAAANYLVETTTADSKIFLADIGAGTSDFSVLQTKGIEDSIEVVVNGGVHAGGDDFDSDIMSEGLGIDFGLGSKFQDTYGKLIDFPIHILKRITKFERLPYLRYNKQLLHELRRIQKTTTNPKAIERILALVENNVSFGLFTEIEKSKKNVSVNDEANIAFNENQLEINAVIRRESFQLWTKEHVREIADCARATLKSADIEDPSKIDAVYLTGGMSVCGPVREMFEKMFGKGKIIQRDPFGSVIKGLVKMAPVVFK